MSTSDEQLQAMQPAVSARDGMPQLPAEAARRVYALIGVPPEIQAYAMAKYSRSSQSMLESIQEISAQRAEQFLNTFYFQYGHRSIADMAHLVLAVENVSILAAIALVDEPLWDGQERSTRYQDFARSGYVIPAEVQQAGLEDGYRQAADGLFAAYAALTAELTEVLVEVVPRPAEMDERQYRRTLRARAFDVTRGLLPLATRTSVGQIVSARVAERQIGRLLASPEQEVREIGAELKRACLEPAERPLDDDQDEVRAAPTLVKYTQPLTYAASTYAALADEARALRTDSTPEDQALAYLSTPAEPLDEIVATLLYRSDPFGRSYRSISDSVGELPHERRRAILERSLAGRGPHDEHLREHRSGYTLQFDLLVDVGAFRDLHRHRRCVQVIQPYSPGHGPADAEEVFRLGLGEEGTALARERGAVDRYRAAIEQAGEAAERLSIYLMPLAYRVRALFKMDAAEAAYLVELRTAPAGHFSYRHVAWAIAEEVRRVYPDLAPLMRATDPNQVVDLLRR